MPVSSGRRSYGRWIVLLASVLTLSPSVPSNASTPWEIVPSTNQSCSWIYGVAARTPEDAWAVGNYYEDEYEPLAQHWDGNSWTVVETPEVADSVLRDVDIGSASTAWAVGYKSISNAPTKTLILKWNGTNWTVTKSPSPSTDPFYGENNLYSVAALPSGEAWAVGYQWTPQGYQALILQWKKSRWQIMPVPPAMYRKMTSVVALSRTNVWAIGYDFTFESGYQPMSLHWNGSKWSEVRPAQVNTGPAYLEGVTATPSDKLWAVGYQTIGGVAQPLFEHWDGVSWQIVPSPQFASGYNFLQSIQAVADDDVWAAGFRTIQDQDVTFAMHWDGTSWSLAETPNVQGAMNRLWDLAADSSGTLWAGGYVLPNDFSLIKTLTLRNAGS